MYANWPMWILNCIRPQIDIYLLLFAFSWKDLEKKNPEGWNNLVEVQLVGGFQMWWWWEHYSGSRRAALDLINPPQATES